MNTAAQAFATDPEDRLRADLYNFLGLILARPADGMLLSQTAALSGDKTPLGQAITALATAAGKAKAGKVEKEYNDLFIGLGRGELLPYASYYMTGFLNEKPLASLRRDMSSLGLSRSETVFEPEDNIASLMEMMGALIVGRFGPPTPIQQQKTFFNAHIAPWAGHFFEDLETAENADLYGAVGRVGREFVEIERNAFRMAAVH